MPNTTNNVHNRRTGRPLPIAARPQRQHAPTPRQAINIAGARAAVRGFNQKHRPKTTKDTYEPKIKEFKEYCDYTDTRPAPYPRYTVDGHKAYMFLFYCAHRKKKTNGCARGSVLATDEELENSCGCYDNRCLTY